MGQNIFFCDYLALTSIFIIQVCFPANYLKFWINRMMKKNKKYLPEDPLFCTWYFLSFKKIFLKVVPVTKCSSKIFQKFYRSKNKVFGPAQISKKTFSEFFSSISWVLCIGTKCEKVVLFGFSTGTKIEFKIFNTIYLLVTFFRPFFRIFNEKRVGLKANRK
jgi:hypothetical protein